MTLKARTQSQSDRFEIIPLFVLLYMAALAFYGIAQVGVWCYEMLFEK